MLDPVPESLIRRLATPVPRYTSYPTAPHFHDGVGDATYAAWLAELPAETPLSLYVHVPFCDRLCWFCGCHTKQVLRYDPIAAYLPVVHREIEMVAARLGGRGRVAALHLGGGSPSMLAPADLQALAAAIRERLTVGDAFEFSIEIDPNDMQDEARYDAFAAAGVTRVSIGVQDFDEKVQDAINRRQSFEQTAAVVEGMRARGVDSVNLDILYGLPHQTLATIAETTRLALSLRPDRIALFGYAHVPWMKTHQRMIDAAALPGIVERYRQAQFAAERIIAAGYRQIGIDHFALPEDGLAVAARTGRLHRNFQGYTTDAAPALLGFGASAISSLPQGHLQNITATGEYMKAVQGDRLPIARGIALDADDRMRAWLIERLMCDFSVPVDELVERFGAELATAAIDEMQLAALCDGDDLVSLDRGVFRITPQARPFARSVASMFDAYLAGGAGRHSVAV